MLETIQDFRWEARTSNPLTIAWSPLGSGGPLGSERLFVGCPTGSVLGLAGCLGRFVVGLDRLEAGLGVALGEVRGVSAVEQ